MSTVTWRKSSRSDTQGNECVEVARLPRSIGVRDSKNPTAPHLTLSPRSFARLATQEDFGDFPADVGHGVVNDPDRRTSHEIDVVVLGPQDGGPRRIFSLGEVKWGEVMGIGHLDRLARVRELLGVRGYDTRATRLACYSGAGFTTDLAAAADRGDALLVGLDGLYG